MCVAQSKSQGSSELELLGELQKIFDQAWQEIAASGHSSDQEAERTRADLAQMIMLAHRSGLAPEAIRLAVTERVHSGTPPVSLVTVADAAKQSKI